VKSSSPIDDRARGEAAEVDALRREVGGIPVLGDLSEPTVGNEVELQQGGIMTDARLPPGDMSARRAVVEHHPDLK